MHMLSVSNGKVESEYLPDSRLSVLTRAEGKLPTAGCCEFQPSTVYISKQGPPPTTVRSDSTSVAND